MWSCDALHGAAQCAGGAEDVRAFLMKASYMVLGLGDVYLGAPCAVPVDPRHRLVVPKYNPARTFTEEGTVGLGGAYMCIYPMDSPGGYQLVGRTLPIWNTWGRVEPFTPEAPWLLRIFDQVPCLDSVLACFVLMMLVLLVPTPCVNLL